MKVFQLRSVMQSTSGQIIEAPCLGINPQHGTVLSRDLFRGNPYPNDWKTVELTFGNYSVWEADFYFFCPGALVCSGRAKDALAPLEDEGEFLPIRIKENPGNWYIYNSINCRSYLNFKKTVWGSSTVSVSDGRVILKHSFWSERIGDDCLFRLKEEGGVNLYCISRAGDPYDGEFKALSECHNLKGLSYVEVWSGGR